MTIPLLLLEDDPAIARTVAYALEREGFTVDHVLLVRDARARLADPTQGYAAAILDVGLPDGNGLDLCRDLRQGPGRHARLPIVMLTARGEELDRVLGLELGADDYLTKPFSPRELCARLRALLRRASHASAPEPASPASPPLLVSDEAGQRIRHGDTWLPLTRREHGLLVALLKVPGRIWSREALLDAVWGLDADSTDRTVDTHIKTLRAKLREACGDVELIVTHRGLGYAIDPARL
ncbi:winged helix-turn-helix domain-containing protein [Aquabacterium sp.]|uniref:winged helix-turn-helix domain-containing protein n=1 Tax=Aquabacterium sp. TaxID=1872578 RepID=UPI003D6CC907